MSRRKDRERFLSLKSDDPDYRGFRGYHEEQYKGSNTTLRIAICSVCGRKRNVPVESTDNEENGYVCLSCREERAQNEPEPEVPEVG